MKERTAATLVSKIKYREVVQVVQHAFALFFVF